MRIYHIAYKFQWPHPTLPTLPATYPGTSISPTPSLQDIGEAIELSIKSPCLWACFQPLSLFQWYPQSKEIFIESQYEMLKLSAFNAQGSRIIVL